MSLTNFVYGILELFITFESVKAGDFRIRLMTFQHHIHKQTIMC